MISNPEVKGTLAILSKAELGYLKVHFSFSEIIRQIKNQGQMNQ